LLFSQTVITACGGRVLVELNAGETRWTRNKS